MITIIGTYGIIDNIDVFFQQLFLFSKEKNTIIQALDATGVYGKNHLISATIHATRAFEQKTNSTNSLALEILLYAAGERQIQKAIKKIGIKKETQTIAFVILYQHERKTSQRHMKMIIRQLLQKFHLSLDNTVLEGNRSTLKRIGITEREIATIPENKYADLVLEKVALVDIIK